MARSIVASGIVVLALGGSVGCGRTMEGSADAPGFGDASALGTESGSAALADGGDVTSCLAPIAPPSPLRRLTTFELNNTLRDLFGDASRPANALPPDPISHNGSFIDTDDMSVSAVLTDGYHALFHDLALEITTNEASRRSLTGCDESQVGLDACKRQFIDSFVPKVFRRGLDAADAADFDAVFASGQKLGGDFASGVRAVIEAALQSPEFLYRVELGDVADTTHPARPSPYEMATRLSYFLWGSTPDSALLQAAAKGQLDTREQIALQARRLLADERAHEAVRNDYLLLFGLGNDKLAAIAAPDIAPAFTKTLADLVERQSELFLDDVTWNTGGDFRSLLTAPFTWANGPLASFYGIPGVSGDTFQRVALDPTRRAGILTQPAFLTVTSRNGATDPVTRGLAVLERMLCVEIPPEPPDLTPPVPTDPLPNATMRQRIEQHSKNPICVTCHRDIDPLGFAFEHYDAFGSWRDTDKGQPVDSSGELSRTDAQGTFNDAIDLVQKLGSSHDAQSCFIGHWMSFAYGRQETADDACSRKVLEAAFTKTNGDVRELLVSLTQTDGFLYRSGKE